MQKQQQQQILKHHKKHVEYVSMHLIVQKLPNLSVFFFKSLLHFQQYGKKNTVGRNFCISYQQ